MQPHIDELFSCKCAGLGWLLLVGELQVASAMGCGAVWLDDAQVVSMLPGCSSAVVLAPLFGNSHDGDDALPLSKRGKSRRALTTRDLPQQHVIITPANNKFRAVRYVADEWIPGIP
jgi:hypothetical protein